MIKLIILEGARGGGKSSIAQRLRQTLPSSTLINMTGFKENDSAGEHKIRAYYEAFMSYIRALNSASHEYTLILDRTFISEQVYSHLYKSYDFTDAFRSLLVDLLMCSDQVCLFHITYDYSDVPERLNRDKRDSFAQYEAMEDIVNQMATYRAVMTYIDDTRRSFGFADRFFMFEVNTSGLTIPQATEEVARLCRKN